jgi:hypothetical protein
MIVTALGERMRCAKRNVQAVRTVITGYTTTDEIILPTHTQDSTSALYHSPYCGKQVCLKGLSVAL